MGRYHAEGALTAAGGFSFRTFWNDAQRGQWIAQRIYRKFPTPIINRDRAKRRATFISTSIIRANSEPATGARSQVERPSSKILQRLVESSNPAKSQQTGVLFMRSVDNFKVGF